MSSVKGNNTSQPAAAAAPAVLADSLKDDPEHLLNEWLGELKTIIGDLDTKVTQNHSQGSPNKPATAQTGLVQTRNRRNRTSEFNRFSMANLEDTHETELDAILGELSLLEMQKPLGMIRPAAPTTSPPQNAPSNPQMAAAQIPNAAPSIINPPISEDSLCLPTAMNCNLTQPTTPMGPFAHHRSNSIVSTSATSTISSLSSSVCDPGYAESTNGSSSNGSALGSGQAVVAGGREPRTESPDNDSAFSDTVSLLSTDTSSTSSGLTTGVFNTTNGGGKPGGGSGGSHLYRGINLQEFDNQKAAKIHLALQKLEQASVRRLFVKAFTADGASKSLLVDETMTCGHVTRLLADKNHVHMDTRWALVEQLPDIQVERLYEDHELLVDKLMMWNRDSKNRILFVERVAKVVFFMRPEAFIPEHGLVATKDLDECNRTYILEEFFNTNSQLAIEGPLCLRGDSKKWKRHHFVLRGSGLYYYPKEKTRSPRDLVCLGLFADCEVYRGFGWRKRHKAPTDHTLLLHASHELANSKTTKPLKVLCADDDATLERWILAMRLAKYGKQLWQSYRRLREDLARDDFDEMATRRSSSINSFAAAHLEAGTTTTAAANGRPLSRASSSSSSGCLSDENNGFDAEFTTGTIKRKPSMKPNLPLTSMTRQLKEVGETREESPVGSPERGGTLTRQRVGGGGGGGGQVQVSHHHMRQRSVDSTGSGGSGCSTLKRRPPQNCSGPAFGERNEGGCGGMTGAPLDEMIKATGVAGGGGGGGITSPLKSMPSCMTDSLFSLPPPPEETLSGVSSLPVDLGSTFSLDSLPPPPSVNELEESLHESSFSSSLSPEREIEEIYSPLKTHPGNRPPPMTSASSLLPPGDQPHHNHPLPPASPLIYAPLPKKELESCLKKATEKIYATKGELKPSLKVHAAAEASPVTLRKKVCFEDQVQAAAGSNNSSPSKRLTTSSSTSSASIYGALPPKPPPRSEATRLSTQPINAASSNNEFLKDLQRVMRKKWQVAQKCKAEPEMTPHEVLGFRDFDAWQKQNNQQLPYYRQTANVSNWVQEHYGPDSLYENLGGDGKAQVAQAPPSPQSPTTSGVASLLLAAVPIGKKRPPPLPPKRSETTILTTQCPSPTMMNL